MVTAQVNVLNPDLGDGTRRLEQHFFLQMTTLGSTEIDHLAGREETDYHLPAPVEYAIFRVRHRV